MCCCSQGVLASNEKRGSTGRQQFWYVLYGIQFHLCAKGNACFILYVHSMSADDEDAGAQDSLGQLLKDNAMQVRLP